MLKPGAAPSRRIDILGVAVSDTTPANALETITSWIERGDRTYVCVTPVSGVMAAQRDPAVLRALNGAGLTVPDGMPIVWSGRYAGADGIKRVYGPELMERSVGERRSAAGGRSSTAAATESPNGLPRGSKHAFRASRSPACTRPPSGP